MEDVYTVTPFLLECTTRKIYWKQFCPSASYTIMVLIPGNAWLCFVRPMELLWILLQNFLFWEVPIAHISEMLHYFWFNRHNYRNHAFQICQGKWSLKFNLFIVFNIPVYCVRAIWSPSCKGVVSEISLQG